MRQKQTPKPNPGAQTGCHVLKPDVLNWGGRPVMVIMHRGEGVRGLIGAKSRRFVQKERENIWETCKQTVVPHGNSL